MANSSGTMTYTRIEELSQQDVLVVLMGISGTGKTHFISKAINESLQLGQKLGSATSEIGLYSYEQKKGSQVVLIDTPGFNDTNKTEIDILEDFIRFLRKIDSRKLHISGIIYLHRITDNRISGSTQRNFFMITRLCGKRFLPHVVLATTMWGGLDDSEGYRRQSELEGYFWKEMIDDGGAVPKKYMGTPGSAHEIINAILERPATPDTIPDIQRESIREAKPLLKTGAGRVIYEDIRNRLQQYDRSINRVEGECVELERELKANSGDPQRERDEEFQELKKERKSLKDQREQLEKLLEESATDGSFEQSGPADDCSPGQETEATPMHELSRRIEKFAVHKKQKVPNEERPPVDIGICRGIPSENTGLYDNSKRVSVGPLENISGGSGPSAPRDPPRTGTKLRVCVAGAGPSGLRCTEVLLSDDCDVIIVEAGSWTGEKVHERIELSHRVDTEPNWTGDNRSYPLYGIAKKTDSVFHSWNGNPIDSHKAALFSRLAKDIIRDTSEQTGEDRPKTPRPERDGDIVRVSEDAPSVFEGESPRSYREMKQLLRRMWKAYVGAPIKQRSLGFARMENLSTGKKSFIASTYKTILDRVEQLALSPAEILSSPRVVEIKISGPDDTGRSRAVVRTDDRNEQAFDEVVLSGPREWLNWNEGAYKQSRGPRLTEAVDSISLNPVEKVFITFPRAFWQSYSTTSKVSLLTPRNIGQNAEFPKPHLPRETDNFSSYKNRSSATLAADSNPHQLSEEACPLAEFTLPDCHTALLFCIYGACSTKLTALIRNRNKKERQANLTNFFQPYFSDLPHYSVDDSTCLPLAFLATDWRYDGLGSYSSFQVGPHDAAGDVVVLRRRLPHRRP